MNSMAVAASPLLSLVVAASAQAPALRNSLSLTGGFVRHRMPFDPGAARFALGDMN